MTTAQIVSYQFGAFSYQWSDENGRHLTDVCKSLSQRVFTESGHRFPFRRYEFPDGSAIITGQAAWGIGWPGRNVDCTCWSGEHYPKHRDKCPAIEGQMGLPV